MDKIGLNGKNKKRKMGKCFKKHFFEKFVCCKFIFRDSPHIGIIVHFEEGKRISIIKMFYITYTINSQKLSKNLKQTFEKIKTL